MFEFTRDEKKAVVFLFSVALAGLVISFCLKFSSASGKILASGENTFRIELNRAGTQELMLSRGLSLNLAKRIIEYRRSCGRFNSLEELKSVKGIGKYRYEKIKDLFYIE